MSRDITCRIGRFLTLVVPFWLVMSVLAEDDQSYWQRLLQRQKAIYDAIQNPATSYDVVKTKHKEGDELRADLIQRLQTNASLARVIRTSLRSDSRVWVRGFAAAVLIKAFGNSSAEEPIFQLR